MTKHQIPVWIKTCAIPNLQSNKTNDVDRPRELKRSQSNDSAAAVQKRWSKPESSSIKRVQSGDELLLSPIRRPRRRFTDNASSVPLSPLQKASSAVVNDTTPISLSHLGRACTWEWKRAWMTKEANALHIQLDGNSIQLPKAALDDTVLLANDLQNDYAQRNGSPLPPDDLITLQHLHEPSVVECLQLRYAHNQVYTNTGPVLIALNPFQALPLYDVDVMRQYWEKAEQALPTQLPPHVYQIADHAFRSMMRGLELHLQTTTRSTPLTKCDQSILVSGESGAGKTVTTKHVLHYLARLSQRAARAAGISYQASQTSVESQVLESNPIVESFGNARTVRNDNSSRFGKFITLQFTSTGRLVGTALETYLLEKVRLVHQAVGERNYHIFYEMLLSLDKTELRALHLDSYKLHDFRILSSSATYDRRDGVSDKLTFRYLRKAMNTMGFTPHEQDDIFAVTAAVLHGSNLTVQDETDGLDLTNPHLEPACALLGVTADHFNDALCFFHSTVRGATIRRRLPLPKVEKGLEAFLKGTYWALFTALVRKINHSISFRPTEDDDPLSRPVATISILDIFGFESFETNSFEQLCINFCNETLQQQFNNFLLKNEQDEYEKEGIAWSFIDYPENQIVLDLIDNRKTGIMSILDDICRAVGGNDKGFAQNVFSTCQSNKRFRANKKQEMRAQFSIEHYAGSVEYTADGFVEKNRDELPREATQFLRGSTKPFVRELGTILEEIGNVVDQEDTSSKTTRNTTSSIRPTVGGHFREQLRDLRIKIDSTAPHYIRTIKPNDLLVPDHFETAIVAEQLRCGGILQAVRVTRAGFTQHYSHADFVHRFRKVAWNELTQSGRKLTVRGQSSQAEIQDECRALVDLIHRKLHDLSNTKKKKHRGFDEEEDEDWSKSEVLLQFGKTKVFLRFQAFEALERLRGLEQVGAATRINAIIRGYLRRQEYEEMKEEFRRELRRSSKTFEEWFKEYREPYYKKKLDKEKNEIPKVVGLRIAGLKNKGIDGGDATEALAKLRKSIQNKDKNGSAKTKWAVVNGVWSRVPVD